MAVKFDNDKQDRLSQLLNDPFSNNRDDIWLWLYLRYQHKFEFPDESCNSKTMRDEIAWVLEAKGDLIDLIPSQRARFLLPESSLHWIVNDARQHEWLRPKIRQITNKNLSKQLVHLKARDRLVAMIDIWNSDLADKATAVEKLHKEWRRHKAKDIELEWFVDKKESAKRCVFAWEWLSRNRPSLTSRKLPISNYEELLIFFDNSHIGQTERKAMISKIKSSWNRRQFDERTADKKQVNVMLSKAVITQLDELAKKHGLKRAQIIEQLIAGESETEIHLSK